MTKDVSRRASELKYARLYEKCSSAICKVCQQLLKRNIVANANLATSEMADSGLETGSISPRENTTSEISSTDLEITQTGESANDDDSDRMIERASEKSKIRGIIRSDDENCKTTVSNCRHENSCIQSDIRNETTYSTSLETNRLASENVERTNEAEEEIRRYENRMLNEPFYESDCGSDENEPFEFSEPVPSTSSSDRHKRSFKADQKASSDPEESDGVTKPNPDSNSSGIIDRNGSASSGYFIDASTLNDDVDIMSASVTRNHPDDNTPYFALTNYPEYKANKQLNNITEEQQSCKPFTPIKSPTLQTGGHERVAEFERELKLNEYLQPFPESRRIKRVDPAASEEKANVSKSMDKESLAVEIKEADSGESAHPSPYPDNNTRSSARDEKAEDTSGGTGGEVAKNDAGNEKKRAANDDKSVTTTTTLIRQNTFELDSNDEKLSVLRQEYERRQGSLVFQSAIPQYSGHRVDGDSSCHAKSFTDPLVPLAAVTDSPPSSIVFPPGVVQLPATVNNVPKSIPYLLNGYEHEVNHQATCKQSKNNFLPSGGLRSYAIYPVTKSASDKSILDYSTDSDDTSNHCSTSLPITLDSSALRKNDRPPLPPPPPPPRASVKRGKCDETTPIISGGVSTTDYSKKSSDSPTVRRKTESTPIVSGGSVMMNARPETNLQINKPARISSSMTAWVVDMSDCGKEDAGSRCKSRSNMSQSYSGCAKRSSSSSVQTSSAHEKHGSLEFFVNLKDISSSGETAQKSDHSSGRKKCDDNGKPYYEFYVDISDKKNDARVKSSEKQDKRGARNELSTEGEKKNIFSMFIDLNDTRESDGRGNAIGDIPNRQSSSSALNNPTDGKASDGPCGNAEDGQVSREQKRGNMAKPSVFMFIESDSPVVRRRTLSTSRPAFKRHSWNVDKNVQSPSGGGNGCVAKELMFRREHRRAHSVSIVNRDAIPQKQPQAKTSSSSHSLRDIASKAEQSSRYTNSKTSNESNSNNMDTSIEDVFDIKDTPPNSHVEINSISDVELRANAARCEYNKEIVSSGRTENSEVAGETNENELSDTWDKTCTESTEGTHTRKSKTFDISSGSSPNSENRDYELSDLMLSNGMSGESRLQAVATNSKISETRKSLNETIKKIECELKEPEYEDDAEQHAYEFRSSKKDTKLLTTNNNNNNNSIKEARLESDQANSSSFVRLSDLDKTPIANHAPDLLTVKDERSACRMSSIMETSWIESKLATTRNSQTGLVKPVPRKLASVMSTSLPSKQKSPLEDLTGDCEGEGIISESDLSSMQSSMGRSGAEGSTEETETSSIAGAKPYNRLGEDLLRMFLEEINPDVTIDVGGHHIKAHKCILSSRCQYFAAMLSGGWIESTGNVISLQGYSYNAVHFALCHIYSGESNIPDSISIVELATLADMLCLEGLKEVIGYTLKLKYCHLFHKPCQICAVGVLECMPLAAAYGLDEVYRKSLRWITKHFVRIWPCKTFATLPRELMEKCFHQHIVHMSTDNVLQTIMDCDKLLATLPNVRWAEPVFQMVSNLLDTSIKFLSENFAAVLGNDSFDSLGRELMWNISRLEDNFLTAVEQLSPEQACKSYSKLNKMLPASSQIGDFQNKSKWGPLFVDFLHKLQSRVEKCLVRDAARAARTAAWLKMDLELRRRIQELACLVILPHENLSSKQHLSRRANFLKESRTSSNRPTISRNMELKRVKMAISEHNDKTLKTQISTSSTSSNPKQTKKVLYKPKTDPLERKMQEDKQTTAETARPRSWSCKVEVKSRYLEPRNKFVPKESASATNHDKTGGVQQRRKIMISSSDSSRTSSPAMKRAAEKKPLTAKIKLTVKKDVKALSSDSLTDATAAATRIANKRISLSKSCGITRPESPSCKQKSTTGVDLSIDSLETKSKASIAVKKKVNKMDTSMSTDSLMTEVTTTPKSNASNKFSPVLAKTTNKPQVSDRTKKTSPPTQHRSPLTLVKSDVKRAPKSLESSTAASRSRAAAISNTYHNSQSLRRNLLDAAKTPDIASKPVNAVTPLRARQQVVQATVLSNVKKEKKETQNSQSSDSPSKKSSPKLSAANRVNKSAVAGKRIVSGKPDDKTKRYHNGETTQKQPTVGSRSGTFLKDEPTILKKVDIKSS